MTRARSRIPTAWLPLLALALACTGCPSPTKTDDGPENPGGGNLEKQSELFVADAGGTVTFTTNDPAYWTEKGYTLWAPTGGSQSPFVSLERTLTKAAGDGDAGYGLVFCHYDTGDSALGETMLVVMINTKGKYIAGEVIGTTFTRLFDWTYSDKLAPGLGVANKLKVTLSGGEFIISINGTEVKRFTDSDPPYHTQGGDGFIVVISPSDSFPGNPVTVVFAP
jgi:hypothetical protein